MDTIFIVINIAIMLIFIFGLIYMQKKHISFSKRVFTGLGLGIIFGFALQFVYGPSSEIVSQSTDWFHLIGGGYIKFYK